MLVEDGASSGANAGSYAERQARKAQYEANLAKQRAPGFEGGAPVRGARSVETKGGLRVWQLRESLMAS